MPYVTIKVLSVGQTAVGSISRVTVAEAGSDMPWVEKLLTDDHMDLCDASLSAVAALRCVVAMMTER